METLLSALTAFAIGLSFSPSVPSPDDARIEWTCSAPQWPGVPDVTNGQFRGTVAVDCTFTGTGAPGNGYPKLRDFMVQEAIKAATTVHAGPTEETLEGVPSIYLETTTPVLSSGTEVVIRADQRFATDGATWMILLNESKSVTGTGNGKYLRSMKSGMKVQNGATPGKYDARSEMALVIDKPGLVPAGIFKNQVIKSVEASLPDEEKAMIEKVAPNL